MPDLEARLRALPKIELHQHVDGSIPAEVTWELMRHYRLNPVDSLEEMRRHLEIQEGEEGTLLAYLDKMHYPLWVTQFYENISRVTEAIVDAAAAAGVVTLELRYSPVIHTYAGLTPRQSIRSALSGMNHARKRHPQMKLGMVVIAMRQHGPHIAKILARQALAEAQHLHERTGVVGFDIAGPERGNPPRLFRSAYEIARLGHLGLTAHAGEDAGAEYVWQAVDELGANRIGHGCAAAKDKELLRRLARDRIAVECCLSSNYHTGAVPAGARHPIHAFLEAGVPVALCCDNSTVSHTDQVREGLRAAEQIGVEAVEAIHQEAGAFSFIRPETALSSGLGD
ncbi:MAG TPA: adenosine deaminase family protein [Vicinamibacteria bacterium]|jgi:adenosine deaminase|nr:adenosine deaminase family protein [Vicinamibacteria bacterium]